MLAVLVYSILGGIVWGLLISVALHGPRDTWWAIKETFGLNAVTKQ
jgi:hypothetical protein